MGDGFVAGGQQPAVFPLLPGIEPDERQGSGQGHRPDRRHDGPIHGAIVTGSMGGCSGVFGDWAWLGSGEPGRGTIVRGRGLMVPRTVLD